MTPMYTFPSSSFSQKPAGQVAMYKLHMWLVLRWTRSRKDTHILNTFMLLTKMVKAGQIDYSGRNTCRMQSYR